MARSSILQSKWIVGTEPDQTVSRVGRIALSQRFTVLQTYLRLAAKRAEKDVEYVHQLRVSTRRTHAALRMFSDVLPPRRTERLNKQLKRLRRTAGVARDLDVLESRFARRAETSSDRRLEAVIDRIRSERTTTQQRIVVARKRLKRGDFESAARGLLKRIRWRGSMPEPQFRDVAQESFRTAVAEFLQAASADLSDLAHLHEMRLAGKRLRYTMELLAGVFQPAFKTRIYPAVQEIQDKLGRVNDHVTASNLLQQWSAQPECQNAELFSELAAEEQGFAESTCRQFHAWWTPRRIEDFRRETERVAILSRGESKSSPAVARGIA